MANSFIAAYEQAGYFNPYRDYTFHELKKELGSTKAASAALGVSARQGARYLAYESGSGSQARSTRKVQGKINSAMKNLLRQPGSTTLDMKGEFKISNDKRDRHLEIELSEDDALDILRDMMENDLTFEESFAPYYGDVEFDHIDADFNFT